MKPSLITTVAIAAFLGACATTSNPRTQPTAQTTPEPKLTMAESQRMVLKQMASNCATSKWPNLTCGALVMAAQEFGDLELLIVTQQYSKERIEEVRLNKKPEMITELLDFMSKVDDPETQDFACLIEGCFSVEFAPTNLQQQQNFSTATSHCIAAQEVLEENFADVEPDLFDNLMHALGSRESQLAIERAKWIPGLIQDLENKLEGKAPVKRLTRLTLDDINKVIDKVTAP